jgi:hypothetical protein
MIIQGENSNRRLQSDLAALKRFVGESWAAVNQSLFIHTIETDEDAFLSLDGPGTIGKLRERIAEIKPDIVCFDTLNCFAVGDLNKDQDMRETCQQITALAKAGNPDRAIVVLHHSLTGKAGAVRATGYDRASFGRNSKTLQAWTRGQINVTAGAADSNDLLIFSCGKCSNGREFTPFAARLDPETMIYKLESAFDFEEWETEVGAKKAKGPAITVDRVAELCKGAMTKSELARLIVNDTGVARSYAFGMLKKAEKARKLHWSKVHETYTAS